MLQEKPPVKMKRRLEKSIILLLSSTLTASCLLFTAKIFVVPIPRKYFVFIQQWTQCIMYSSNVPPLHCIMSIMQCFRNASLSGILPFLIIYCSYILNYKLFKSIYRTKMYIMLSIEQSIGDAQNHINIMRVRLII